MIANGITEQTMILAV